MLYHICSCTKPNVFIVTLYILSSCLLRAILLTLTDYLRVASNMGKTPIEKVVGGVRLNTVICRKCLTVSTYTYNYVIRNVSGPGGLFKLVRLQPYQFS